MTYLYIKGIIVFDKIIFRRKKKMALKVALQLYSIREDMAKDYVKAMTEVAKMGYQGVEFAGFVADPAEMGKLARDLGMEPISCHYPYAKIVENPEKAFNDCLAEGDFR